MKFLPDKLLCFLILAVIAASIAPISGALEVWFSLATKLMIALLFFFQGAKLPRQAVVAGMLHWRLHTVVFIVTFIIFPLFGIFIGLAIPNLKESPFYMGILYLCVLPSTIQSSSAFTSIAGGNVPAAIVSASISNLLGLVITPLWVFILFNTAQGSTFLSTGTIKSIFFQLFLPFLIGQIMQRRVGGFIKKHQSWTASINLIAIIMVVYLSFCQAMNGGLWRQISWHDLSIVIFVDIGLLALIVTLNWWGAKLLRFNRSDRIAITFCGSKKSLGGGVSMANILFSGIDTIGTIIIPVMFFYQIQLMVCSVIARALSKGIPPDAE
ncbi:bile acid:sodium symporter family protein [Bartonella sp. DGB2]|uniref:bile acid:sodium symporter family protein n=1 Tax=Bartonella sp. DGB2 TaxID=3388426 RepID=UPI00398FCF86